MTATKEPTPQELEEYRRFLDLVQSRRLVVIESPYAGDVDRNTRYLRACMRDSLARGEAPFASHMLYTGVLDDQAQDERDLGIACGLAWGRWASASIVYEDFGISGGMKIGIERATSEGRVVEYRRLGGVWCP